MFVSSKAVYLDHELISCVSTGSIPKIIEMSTWSYSQPEGFTAPSGRLRNFFGATIVEHAIAACEALGRTYVC